MTAQVLVCLLALLCLGLVLLWLGLRGRRVNDHPVCRFCRFDLHGAYPGTVTCPECGAGLKAPGAVISGQRRRRRTFLAAGAALVLLPVVPIGLVLFAAMTGSNINGYLPAGILIFQSRFASPNQAAMIGQELLSRQTKGTLSPAQLASAVEAALQRQGDPAKAWDRSWGDLVERARVNGTLTKNDLQRFLNQATVLAFTARSTVRAGDPLPVAISTKEARAGSTTRWLGVLRLGRALIDGQPADRAPSDDGSPTVRNIGFAQLDPLVTRPSVTRTPDGGFVLLTPKGLAPGQHRLDIEVDLQASMPSPTGWSVTHSNDRPTGDDVVVLHRTIEFDVLPTSDEPIKRLEPTADTTRRLTDALTPGLVSCFQQISLMFPLDASAPPCAFEVFAKQGGKPAR